ncbi:hypothetical protein BKA70DRAFT_1239518 [Coprinopsis sp. MPI-PUGE-AT-0042]|nr:hypothetical protein BKA70DRAFT_1239518 [Coprinopsis sp. MPI-PUGE-AT-0042]
MQNTKTYQKSRQHRILGYELTKLPRLILCPLWPDEDPYHLLARHIASQAGVFDAGFEAVSLFILDGDILPEIIGVGNLARLLQACRALHVAIDDRLSSQALPGPYLDLAECHQHPLVAYAYIELPGECTSTGRGRELRLGHVHSLVVDENAGTIFLSVTGNEEEGLVLSPMSARSFDNRFSITFELNQGSGVTTLLVEYPPNHRVRFRK